MYFRPTEATLRAVMLKLGRPEREPRMYRTLFRQEERRAEFFRKASSDLSAR